MAATLTTPDADPEQVLLPFAPRVTGPSPYRASPSQTKASDLLHHWIKRILGSEGGLTSIALTGPRGSGKSRLVDEALAARQDLQVVRLQISDTLPLDVFAEINAATAEGRILILEGRRPVDKWFIHDPVPVPMDLTSRLAAAPEITLDRPGTDALLRALRADLDVHGHRLSYQHRKAVAASLPRHFSAPRLFCQALDEAPADRPLADRLEASLARVEEQMTGTLDRGVGRS